MKLLIILRTRLLQLEEILLVSAFLGTLTIAVLQIFLRNFFDTGILWGDSFLRIAVLWLGMLGALFASRHNNHINISLGLKFLSKRSLKWAKVLVHLFTALICSLVAWYGFNLVLMEYDDGGIAFTISTTNVPVWLTVCIIPASFLMMALRYSIWSLLLLSGKTFFDEPPGESTSSNITKRDE